MNRILISVASVFLLATAGCNKGQVSAVAADSPDSTKMRSPDCWREDRGRASGKQYHTREICACAGQCLALGAGDQRPRAARADARY